MFLDTSGRCRARPSARARLARVDIVLDFRSRICDSGGTRSGQTEAYLRARFVVPPGSFYRPVENLPRLTGDADDVCAAVHARDVGEARVLSADLAHGFVPDLCVLNLEKPGFFFLLLSENSLV